MFGVFYVSLKVVEDCPQLLRVLVLCEEWLKVDVWVLHGLGVALRPRRERAVEGVCQQAGDLALAKRQTDVAFPSMKGKLKYLARIFTRVFSHTYFLRRGMGLVTIRGRQLARLPMSLIRLSFLSSRLER